MLRHIRLLILDLDYLVFDCALLKAQALRQSLISLDDAVPTNFQMPESTDVEEGFLEHGFRWMRHLEMGLDQKTLARLGQAYGIFENRLIQSSIGRLYSGIEQFLVSCRQLGAAAALGAEASRDYLVAVTDRYRLDSLFQIALCTEEFGIGDADEMLGEILHQAEVNPSETLVLGTRPLFFQAARNLNMRTIGCGWGIRQHNGLAKADFQSLTLAQLYSAIQQADALDSEYLE